MEQDLKQQHLNYFRWEGAMPFLISKLGPCQRLGVSMLVFCFIVGKNKTVSLENSHAVSDEPANNFVVPTTMRN